MTIIKNGRRIGAPTKKQRAMANARAAKRRTKKANGHEAINVQLTGLPGMIHISDDGPPIAGATQSEGKWPTEREFERQTRFGVYGNGPYDSEIKQPIGNEDIAVLMLQPGFVVVRTEYLGMLEDTLDRWNRLVAAVDKKSVEGEAARA